jgi:exopolysaccharide biosynthesis operon protein EpsL
MAGSMSADRHALALGNDTVFVRADTGFTYESNVFRVTDEDSPSVEQFLGGRGKSDMVWSVGAGVRMDLPVSRQRFRVDASAVRYLYSEFDELDYTGYNARGIWDWRVGNDWHGQLGAGVRNARRTYSDELGFIVPSLYKSYDALLDVRYALTARWELETGATSTRTRYEAEELRVDDFDLTTLKVGAQYRTPAGNGVGLRLRYEQGEWPNRPPAPIAFFDNEYDQYTLSAVVDWRVTGKSRLFGDVGYTRRQRAAEDDRDFTGPSGRLAYDYQVTGKSAIRGSIYETRGPVEDFTATYVKTTGIDLSYTYQMTAKITAQATATYRRIDYLGSAVVAGAPQREDRLTDLGVSVTYKPRRTLSFSTGATHESRSSNLPLGDYSAYTLYVTAGVEF